MPSQLEVFYREGHKGDTVPPLLFVHGAYCGGWVWETYFTPWLAERGWDCHALSLEGHGESEGHVWLSALGVDDFVRNLKATIDTLPRPPVLIGHSMGGLVIQRYLEMYPNCPPAGVVMLASVPPNGISQSAVRMLQTAPDLLAALNVSQASDRYHPSLNQTRALLFSADLPDALLVEWAARFQAESLRAIFELSMLGFFHAKPPVALPALVLGGADDQIISSQDVIATAELFNVSAEVMPNMAHLMMLDTGWERVANRIDDWLNQVFSASL